MGRMPKDMRQLMQQAQQMQEQMRRAQDALAEQEFEGTAGGGVIKAIVKGSGEVVAVHLDPSVLDPEDPDLVGDLVVAAVNQALKAAGEAASSTMGGLTGGLDLGGLLG